MRVSQHRAQASAKALLGTRLYIVDVGKLHIPWAPQVIDLKIRRCIRPTVTWFHNMAAVPRCVFGHWLEAGAAPASLLHPYPIQLCSTFYGREHPLAPARLEVLIPFRVVRVGSSLDLDMSHNWRVRGVQ